MQVNAQIGVCTTRWIRWCTYLQAHGHLFETPLKIPVPRYIQEVYLSDDPQTSKKMLEYAIAEADAGRLYMPPEPPDYTIPPRTMQERARVHGIASGNLAQGFTKGFMEGVKSAGVGQQVKKAFFRSLFKR